MNKTSLSLDFEKNNFLEKRRVFLNEVSTPSWESEPRKYPNLKERSNNLAKSIKNQPYKVEKGKEVGLYAIARGLRAANKLTNKIKNPANLKVEFKLPGAPKKNIPVLKANRLPTTVKQNGKEVPVYVHLVEDSTEKAAGGYKLVVTTEEKLGGREETDTSKGDIVDEIASGGIAVINIGNGKSIELRNQTGYTIENIERDKDGKITFEIDDYGPDTDGTIKISVNKSGKVISKTNLDKGLLGFMDDDYIISKDKNGNITISKKK